MDEWQEQMRQRATTLEELKERFLPGMAITDEMLEAERSYPIRTTPYYVSLVKRPDFTDPVFAQIVASGGELIYPPWLSEDPLGETNCSPAARLVHRYPDRALIVATSICATRCRHCTRKRILSAGCEESAITENEVAQCIDYLRENPGIDDVLVSGGDPLTMWDDRIDMLLSAIRNVTSVKVIRLATRTLVNMPMRFTDRLVGILAKHKPVFVNTHFNHPAELAPAAIAAADKLTDAGIPVANQTVLLRGINDSAQTIETLCRNLFHHRIRPYYLFQCDLVCGIEHLRTPLQTGLDIMKHLRGRLSGMAIPNFAFDTPGKGGKIELLPDSIIGRDGAVTYLMSSRGESIAHPDPAV